MNYKILLVVPVVLLILSVGLLANSYITTGEWFTRSIDLKGGTIITVSGEASLEDVKTALPEESRVRMLGGFGGGGFLIEIPTEVDVKSLLAALGEKGLQVEDASIQTIGPSLGETFWAQAQIGMIFAFILMGIVVFFLFRSVVPSFAVIFAAVSDIVITLALMQIFGVPLSLAGLAALLMRIGYSVDTDILLTTRMLRGEGPLVDRVKDALKTGLTISFTTIGVLLVVMFSGISPLITQIATVLLIGLVIDIANTWLMNSVVLRWYMERRAV